MKKKKILSFIDWYLPGYRAGGTIRAFSNMTDYLGKNFEFYIVTRDCDYQSNQPYENIIHNKWNQLTDNVYVKYLSQQDVNKAVLRSQFSEFDFDAVYVHGMYSYNFSILPVLLAKKTSVRPIVVAAHGMLGAHAVNVKSKKKQLFLSAAKLIGLYKDVVFHAANTDEENDIKKNIGKNAHTVVAREFPRKISLNLDNVAAKKPGALRLISVARISPEKNQKFAIEVLKNIEGANIVFDIFGPVYDKKYWSECESLIQQLPKGIEVNYKGSLKSDDVVETMKKYHFLFLPTTGENFGHTILESMMACTPVIISDKTPWKNLEKENAGWDLQLTDKVQFESTVKKVANYSNDELNVLRQKTLEYARQIVFDEEVLKENEILFTR